MDAFCAMNHNNSTQKYIFKTIKSINLIKMTSDVMEHLFSYFIIYSFEKLRQNYTATEFFFYNKT